MDPLPDILVGLTDDDLKPLCRFIRTLEQRLGRKLSLEGYAAQATGFSLNDDAVRYLATRPCACMSTLLDPTNQGSIEVAYLADVRKGTQFVSQ